MLSDAISLHFGALKGPFWKHFASICFLLGVHFGVHFGGPIWGPNLTLFFENSGFGASGGNCRGEFSSAGTLSRGGKKKRHPLGSRCGGNPMRTSPPGPPSPI